MSSVVRKTGKFLLSCAFFCSQLACGIPSGDQKNQDVVKIGGKTLGEYLKDDVFSRRKIRNDLKQLDIDSAQKLRDEVVKFSPGERKNVFYEEIDKFASLGDVVKEVNNWGSGSIEAYRKLFDEQEFPSVEGREICNKLYWLAEVNWVQDCEGIEIRLKERCRNLLERLKDFL